MQTFEIFVSDSHAPEITTATVKQAAELSNIQKRVNRYEIAAAASYSHRKMLPTR
jgi:hypothetical protein